MTTKVIVKNPFAKQPPADSIWTRYSPHGEIPLSGVGSFTLHALGIGLFVLMGLFVYSSNKVKELPVEVVKLSGGGRGAGTGVGDGTGSGTDIEDGKGNGDGSVVEGPKDDGALTLDPKQIAVVSVAFKDDPDALRAIQKGHPNAKMFAEMSDAARQKLRAGLNPGGSGGTAEAGIKGGNSGDGTGGEKGRSPNEREKRMFRWRIPLDQSSPAMLLSQLDSMGAFLGVPVRYDNQKMEWSYRSIHNLRQRPARLQNEDPTTLGLLRWGSNASPAWIAVLMRELQVNAAPTHFLVFFPRELEEEFAKVEREYLAANKLELSQIDETSFALQPKGKRFVPVIVVPPHMKAEK